MYKLTIHRRALNYLKKLPKNQQNKIKTALHHLRAHPFESEGIKRMIGEWSGYYRLRLGNIRIIFWIDNDVIYVDYMGSRGDIYKK
ncbi:mRNA interferase RelE/StbE [Candidatus Magnetomoraceae bacterium gMMP-15]